MKRLISLLLPLFMAFFANAQHDLCGFDRMHDKLMARDTNYANHVQKMKADWIAKQNAANNSMYNYVLNGYGQEYVIPVVVHVIHTGGAVGTIYNPHDTVIQNAIEYMNKTYAATWPNYVDTNSGGVRFPIRFELAKRSASCGPTNGIIRVNGSSLSGYASNGVNADSTNGADDPDVKALSRYDSREYYNIWVVNKIDGKDGTSGSFIAGYAYFPGATDTIDGTIILATRMKADYSTLPHELGHAFNLYHTFEGDAGGASCPSNTTCAAQGDLVCDTDPHKRNASTCPFDAATNTCTGLAWSNNYTHKNIMDYSSCRNRFSAGQRTRWLDALTTYRPGLGSSIGAVDTGTNVVSASCTTTINSANISTATGANMGPVRVELSDMISNSKGFGGDHLSAYIDRSCTQRATVIAGKSYTLSVNTETNRQDVQVYVDYNNNGSFSTAGGEQIYTHNTALSSNGNETHSTTYSVPTSGITTCTPLRMRVVSDWYTSSHLTNGCGQLDYGQAEDFSILIKPASDTVTITNSITSGTNPTCSAGSVTFTASATKTLTSPSYQWYLNSQPVGSNSATYSVSSLSTGTYYVHCKVKYTGACYSDSVLTNTIALTVNGSSVTPSVSIAASSSTICSGTSVTFTPTPTNGGASPSYQWKLNGGNIATGSTYTTSSLSNGDQVSCVMTSNASCASPTTATSNTVTMTVTGTVTPSVSIAASSSTICSGTSVTFTPTPTNGGTPTYQWKLNGSNIATGSTYTTSSLSNGDQVSCVMTSTASCASPTTATSNTITMTVTGTVTPSVSIASSAGTSICSGTSVTFTPTPTNGGTPSYQWKLNGSNIATGSTYTTSSLSNGDQVSCVMTSTASCASPTTATSNTITMTVSGSVTPSVSIASSAGTTICSGTSVTFTPTPTGGGTSPSYQWKLNGSNIATGSTYTTSSLSNGDQVSCVMTSSSSCASPTTATSNTITMTVTAAVTPSVTIASGAGTTICAGASVTFTPTPTGGGTSPSYQWKLNGSNIAIGSTYVTTSLANGDQVSCVMTSNATCASPTTATSNTITMTVSATVTPSVTIASGAGTTICSGTSVTFTPTPTNGGTSPSYQWKVNGSNVSTNNTYTTSTLSNGDQVSCVMTSSSACASPTTATSNTITMTVNAKVTPAVTIAVVPNDTICNGTSVTFTPTPTNGGTSPSYQWKVNGSNVSTNSTYTTSSLSNGDAVTCVLTSSETCVTTSTATSNSITMTVNPNLTPAVTIAASATTICSGTSVTFTPTPTNGGTSPGYQWKVNGSNVSTNSTYTTSSLSNGDVVTCVLTSSETCLTTSTATSNSITMTVNPNLTPAVTIAVSPNDTICSGTSVTFTQTPTNGGTSPTYQWKVNGTNAATGTTFTTSTLSNNDVVTVVLTSNAACLTTSTATSSGITMTVNPNLTPAVTIAAAPNDTICAGTNVTFTATPTNGGTTPSYQWKVNGTNTATGGTFSTTTLANGDAVTVELTSSEMCVTSATATSSAINMTVVPLTVPTINILANTGTTICQGGEVTFSSNISGGGTAQTYQWTLNGTNIAGATNTTYTTNTLSSGDAITCKLNITAACPSPDSAESTPLIMTTVNPSLTVMVTPNDTICDNVQAMYMVSPANAGTSAQYQWYINGNPVIGATGASYTLPSVNHSDRITASFTGSANCVNATPVAGDTVTMTVNPTTAPGVSITPNPGTSVPEGQMVWFTSSVNATGIQYQWRKNGVDIPGATGIIYTLLNPQDGDEISLWIRTNDSCRTPDTAISNSVTLNVGVGVATIPAPIFDAVSIAPNPNAGTFTLEGVINSTVDADFVNIEVVNTLGAVVHREQVQIKGHELKTTIELGDKAHNGMHIIRLHAGGHVHLLKFIVGRL